MNITGLKKFRIETEWPCHIDVEQEDQNIMASVNLIGTVPRKPWQGQVVRVLLKDYTIGIFVSAYPDAEPKGWWKGAEIIFKHAQSAQEA